MSALFLPLYFTLSGLSTNLGLLDNGITWGYLIAVTIIAFSAKFFGAALAARLCGMVWRESFSIGALMSCKGLVELIVLNIGLQARILSDRVFTMVGDSTRAFLLRPMLTCFSSLSWRLSQPLPQRRLLQLSILPGISANLRRGSAATSIGILALRCAMGMAVPATTYRCRRRVQRGSAVF